MKILRNLLLHHGQELKAGQVLELEVLPDEQHQALVDKIMVERSNQIVYRAPVARDVQELHGKISQTELDKLVADGVISLDDSAALPNAATTPGDVKDQNRRDADEDTAKWDGIKREQTAERAANVAAPQAPQSNPSQVAQGTAADAAAADAAAKAAANTPAPAAPQAPAAPAPDQATNGGAQQ